MATETLAERTVVLHPGDVYLSADQAIDVRNCLIVGLAAYGEILEKRNQADVAEMCGTPWPKKHIPAQPTASAATVSEFAAALSYVEGSST